MAVSIGTLAGAGCFFIYILQWSFFPSAFLALIVAMLVGNTFAAFWPKDPPGADNNATTRTTG